MHVYTFIYDFNMRFDYLDSSNVCIPARTESFFIFVVCVGWDLNEHGTANGMKYKYGPNVSHDPLSVTQRRRAWGCVYIVSTLCCRRLASLYPYPPRVRVCRHRCDPLLVRSVLSGLTSTCRASAVVNQ